MRASPKSSEVVAVGAASVTFTGSLGKSTQYLFISQTACWITQGTSPITAVADTDGSMYVPADTPVSLHGRFGPNLAVIQDAAGGQCVLVEAF